MIPSARSLDDTEQAFYDALRRGDVDAAMAAWADDDDIVCTLPSGQPSVGAVAIRAALSALLCHGGLDATLQRVHSLQSHACAVHNVLMRIGAGTAERWVIATDVYCKSMLGWQLVAHHSGVGSPDAPPDTLDPATAGLLH